MPVMGGVEAIGTLKSDPATSDVPIIALTAEGSSALAEKAKAAGCDDFHRTPITPRRTPPCDRPDDVTT